MIFYFALFLRSPLISILPFFYCTHVCVRRCFVGQPFFTFHLWLNIRFTLKKWLHEQRNAYDNDDDDDDGMLDSISYLSF